MKEFDQKVHVDEEKETDGQEMTYVEMLAALARAGFIGKVECPTWDETHYLIAGDVISIFDGFRKGVRLNDEPINFDREEK